MSGIPIRASKRALRKALNTFANISVVALLTLTVSTGCAATVPLRPETEKQADRVITEQVRDVLAADPTHYLRHVDVYVRDGVATLSGIVWEPQDIYRARELTARVPGVVRVLNQMELHSFSRE
jgi:osmotically-inducible protein OsmY